MTNWESGVAISVYGRAMVDCTAYQLPHGYVPSFCFKLGSDCVAQVLRSIPPTYPDGIDHLVESGARPTHQSICKTGGQCNSSSSPSALMMRTPP